MRRHALLLALAALTLLIASPASAYVLLDEGSTGAEESTTAEEGTGEEVLVEVEPTPLPPTKRTERVYLTCDGTTKADNVNRQNGEVTTWDLTAPTASVQAGAGCGFLDAGIEDSGNPGTGTPLDDVWVENVDKTNDPSFDALFRGTFTGNLDNLTLELHRIHGPTDRAYEPLLGSNFLGEIRLEIDGEVVPLTTNEFEAPTVTSSSGASQMLLLSLTNLGLMVEEGDGVTVRTIEVGLDHVYSDTEGIWVWDTTEVPSGITFNPATLAPTKISKV